MGAKAEQRFKLKTRRDLEALARPAAFDLMDALNGLEKYPDAGVPPLSAVVLRYDGTRWWVLDPGKMYSGRGFWYATLHEAVKRWRIMIVGYDEAGEQWLAVPFPS
jgi:hypothetical protein